MNVYEVFVGFLWDFYRTNCTKVYYWRSQDQTKSQPPPSSGVDWALHGDSCWGFNKPTWGYSLQFYDRKMGYTGIYRDRLIARYMMFGCANRSIGDSWLDFLGVYPNTSLFEGWKSLFEGWNPLTNQNRRVLSLLATLPIDRIPPDSWPLLSLKLDALVQWSSKASENWMKGRCCGKATC